MMIPRWKISLRRLFRSFLARLVPSNLTVRYWLALSGIAALLALEQFTVQVVLDRLYMSERKLRQAERHQLIADRVVRSALELQLSAADNPERSKVIAGLEEGMADLRSLHGLLGDIGGEVRTHAGLVRALQAARAELESAVEELSRIPFDAFRARAAGHRIFAAAGAHRQAAADLLSTFESRTRERIEEVKRMELLLFAFTLCVIAWVGIYVFRPAVKRLYEALQVRSEFIGRMSHEIRNPLHSLLGMTEVLSGTPLGPEQARYVGIIRKSSLTLLEMLNRMLDFSALDMGKVRLERLPFDPREAIDKAIDLIAFQAQAKGLTLSIRVAPQIPTRVIGDAVRLQQILVNLLGNAVKFTERGRVELRVVPDPLVSGATLFEVEDTGMGISRGSLDRIFESFGQADDAVKRKYGGAGLGLSISRDLVRLMGGTLAVRSEPGTGSTFHFSIPLTGVGTEAEAATSESRPASRTRVLAADDSTENLELVRAYLAASGCELECVHDGREAVETLRRRSFDIVLMDIRMEEMDGISALRAIRAEEKAAGRAPVPVIAVTAENRLEEHAKLMAEGFDSVIAKPIDRARLVQQILARASSEDGGIEDEIRRLAPQYLENRRRELEELRGAIDRLDFERLARIGHRLRGNAKTYGFPELSDLGARLESAAERRDGADASGACEGISAYVAGKLGSEAGSSSKPSSLPLR